MKTVYRALDHLYFLARKESRVKKVVLAIIIALLAFPKAYGQGFFSTGAFTNTNFGSGPTSILGWGENFDRTIDARPNPHPYLGTMTINYHTGLTFSAHSVYGGIRFYNQGYPNAYDPATGSVMAMSITNGNVGIRTNDPQATLEVNGSIKAGMGGNQLFYNGAADLNFTFADRGSGGRAMVHDNGNILTLNFDGDFTGGTKLGRQTYFNEDGAGTSYLNGGNVGIGTTDTKGYKFAVNGGMVATAITVKSYGNWPDYVFSREYPLLPLSGLKAYNRQQKHLPDIPSAKKIAEKGINLGEMNAVLTKKVEELTLYLLQLKDEKDKTERLQQGQIRLLNQRLKSLTHLIQNKYSYR
jgi:hypothetical protein